ncbi:MAG: hypothetical protein A3F87_04900 [Omnitrophica WOR_2 bacterium RIFCSPLOWO2_12_FULL_51_24]|nr:MAG: hypothetical protein A3F87_04900 [Omnitrophica WOR_2 bacterium RIFCSPLOWO2_12_FULL_51_24]
MKNIIIFITTGSKKEAEVIARDLVGKRLAACVSILPSVESVYTWKGRIQASKECLLIAKTEDRLFLKVEKAVKRLHSYECPEIVAFQLSKGSADYMRWIKESTGD